MDNIQLCGQYPIVDNIQINCINDNLYKVFDQMLYQQISEWYKPGYEQAGAQNSRDCNEQILTFRLLCDYVKRKNVKLFLHFIDIEKAYDKIPRHKLLEELKLLGWSKRTALYVSIWVSATKWLQ